MLRCRVRSESFDWRLNAFWEFFQQENIEFSTQSSTRYSKFPVSSGNTGNIPKIITDTELWLQISPKSHPESRSKIIERVRSNIGRNRKKKYSAANRLKKFFFFKENYSIFPYLCIIHWHPIGIYARLLLKTALERISNILFVVVVVVMVAQVFVYDSKKKNRVKNDKREENVLK